MTPHLDSDLLRTFVAIADTGSFTKGADRVGRTQSAVSIQMKKLEEVAGDSLFRRGPRGVVLTRPGEKLATYARRILALLDQAAQSLRSTPLDGSVRIGIPEEYGGTILPDVLARFAKRHPSVEVTVKFGPSSDLNAGLDNGELDLVVVHEEAVRLGGEVLLHDPIVWVTSKTHLTHELDPIPVGICQRGCWWRDWALSALEQNHKSYRVAFISRSTTGLRPAVASGMAVAVMARSMIPDCCRELTPQEGFPQLQASNIVLRRRVQARCNTKDSMAQAIRDAFRANGIGKAA